jgi:hypothetical protein
MLEPHTQNMPADAAEGDAHYRAFAGGFYYKDQGSNSRKGGKNGGNGLAYNGGFGGAWMDGGRDGKCCHGEDWEYGERSDGIHRS